MTERWVFFKYKLEGSFSYRRICTNEKMAGVRSGVYVCTTFSTNINKKRPRLNFCNGTCISDFAKKMGILRVRTEGCCPFIIIFTLGDACYRAILLFARNTKFSRALASWPHFVFVVRYLDAD